MISAFGVEHGEIEKAFKLRLPKLGKKKAPLPTRPPGRDPLMSDRGSKPVVHTSVSQQPSGGFLRPRQKYGHAERTGRDPFGGGGSAGRRY